MVWGKLEAFAETSIHKIFETNSSFQLKECTTRKVSFLFFNSFLLILIKFSISVEDWALGYYYIWFRHFSDISSLHKILSLKSFVKWWGNSYTPCLWVIIAHRFTCGARKTSYKINILKVLWNWLSEKLYFPFYVFMNSSNW